MNQTFSLSRFGRLLRTYFVDNRGQLLINIAMLMGILIVGAASAYRTLPPEADSLRSSLYFVLGWAGWFAFTWQQTDVVNQKEQAITYLLRPASQLEKFVLLWLISGAGFVLFYTIAITIVDAFGTTYINSRRWDVGQLNEIRVRGGMLKLLPYYESKGFLPPAHILTLTALAHPFWLMFLLFFRRFSLSIVALITVAVIIFGIFGNTVVVKQLVGMSDVISVKPFEGAIVRSPNNSLYRQIDLPQPLGNQLRYIVGIVVVMLLYITAYFRLKEREV